MVSVIFLNALESREDFMDRSWRALSCCLALLLVLPAPAFAVDDVPGDTDTSSSTSAPSEPSHDSAEESQQEQTPSEDAPADDPASETSGPETVDGGSATRTTPPPLTSPAAIMALDPPHVSDDSYTVTVGGSLDVPAPGLLANDDPLPSGLHVTRQTTLTDLYGYVLMPTINDDGSIRLEVPATTTPGQTYDLAYCMGPSASPGTACASNTAKINVTTAAPHAVNDAYTAGQDDTLTVSDPGVLDNDEPGGHAPGARNASTPGHGSIALSPGGGFTYTPDPGFTGVDTFTYELYDVDTGDLLDTATVTITVTQGLSAVDDFYQTDENTDLTVAPPGLLANDTDPSGNATASLSEGAQHGSVIVQPDGGFTYIPDDGFSGSDTFRYALADVRARGSAVAEVSIEVVAAPTGTADEGSEGPGDAALPDTGSPVGPGALLAALLTTLVGLALMMASRQRGGAHTDRKRA
jgi:hypothetical protein